MPNKPGSRATKVHLMRDNINVWCRKPNVGRINTTKDFNTTTCGGCLRIFRQQGQTDAIIKARGEKQ